MKDFFRVRYQQQQTKFLILASVTTFAVMYLLALLAQTSSLHILIAPLGATCMIVYGLSGLPIARARNVIGAYAIASALSVIIPHSLWGMAASIALTMFIMIKLNLIHPPAGGVPIAIYYMHTELESVLTNIFVGLLIIIIISYPFNYVVKHFIMNRKK